MVHHKDHLVSDTADGVFILFAGTGGKTKDYGIAQTAGPISNRMAKMNWSTVAFENPLYWQGDQPVEVRQPFIDQYGTLDAQADWMISAISYVLERNKGKKVWVGVRSTSSGVMLHLAHLAYIGDERARVLERIEGVLAQGVLDPDVSKWYQAERDFLVSVGRADLPVLEKDLVTFPAMRWGGAEKCEGPPKIRIPRFYIPIGANDEVSSAATQLEVIDRLSESHPQMRIVGVGMDTKHNPEGSVEYENIDGEMVKVRTMKRLGPLIISMISGELDGEPPGLRLFRNSAFTKVKSVCADVAARFAELPSDF